MASGTRLTERGLAERLRVSRSPVRAALRHLEAMEIVSSAGNRGSPFTIQARRMSLLGDTAGRDDEETYLAIAQDRLEGRVPDRSHGK